MELGRLIKTIRVAIGLSQDDLAQRLQISKSYLSLLETGKRIPSNELIDRISSTLSVSREALVFLTTSAPNELDEKKTAKYRKLQENIASILIFQKG